MILADFDVLSLDCYGTLIDWEAGLLQALRPALRAAGIPPEQGLQDFARHEATVEATQPHLPYRAILAEVYARLATDWGLPVTEADRLEFATSVGSWPPFPDTIAALAELGLRYDLAVLSNVDRVSFAATSARLGIPFHLVLTAEDIGSYKPDPRNFAALIARLPGRRILHVAQSLYHDIVPAARAGLATCFIDRRAGLAGFGATPPPPAPATPDFTFKSLAALAAAARGALPGRT